MAYLLGSIPFGYLIVRATQGADVRETGSGGTGATNVSRRAGKGAGVLTLILDALKGAAAIVVAKLVLGFPILASSATATSSDTYSTNADWILAAAGVAALVGHIFPVWLKFRGGKGVATGVGMFLMLAPIAVGLALIVFVVVVVFTRYVSLGSIIGALSIPAFVAVQHAFIRPVPSFMTILIAAIMSAGLILFAHRQNIGRLMSGTESKFK